MNLRTLAPTAELGKRPHSDDLNCLLGVKLRVLDKGFVRVVDYMGNDAATVQAARISHGEGTKTLRDDRGLIRYLMRHEHMTPFEMCEIKLHVKLPIFVARQWIRHRTANVNEISARYSIMADEFYIPDPSTICEQSTSNKQGRGAVFDEESADVAQDTLAAHAQLSYKIYNGLLETPDQPALAREIARNVLPLSTYTEWYWKTDLRNLFHFLKLRSDPHAQFEIRCYAQAIADIVRNWVPEAYQAFLDYQQNAHSFSSMEMDIIRSLLAAPLKTWLQSPESKETALSDREMVEFTSAIL